MCRGLQYCVFWCSLLVITSFNGEAKRRGGTNMTKKVYKALVWSPQPCGQNGGLWPSLNYYLLTLLSAHHHRHSWVDDDEADQLRTFMTNLAITYFIVNQKSTTSFPFEPCHYRSLTAVTLTEHNL